LAERFDRRLHQLALRELLFGACAGLGRPFFRYLSAPRALARKRSAFPRRDAERPGHRGTLAIVVAAAGQDLFERLLCRVRGIGVVLEDAAAEAEHRWPEELEHHS